MDQMVTGSSALTGKPKMLIEIDLTESPYKNDMIHNRWHPDIPIVAWVKPGDDFVIQTYDWTGGFIQNNESADDVRDIDLTIVHFLSGPIGVEGAEPGDLLVVDLLDVGALPESLWGRRRSARPRMPAAPKGRRRTRSRPKARAPCRRASTAAIATSRISRAARRSISRST